jgi:hypothetical protein
MGKHKNGHTYLRPDKDFFPTPSWVTEALAEHIDLRGTTVWECAAGDGRMAEALKACGAARVFCSDIMERGGYPLDRVLVFISDEAGFDVDYIITNPAWGEGNKLAELFIEFGLRRLKRGTLALLLPVDFDSAKTRYHLFAGEPRFMGKVSLLRRPVWFVEPGKKPIPKDNMAWFLWSAIPVAPPTIRYAPRPSNRRHENV